MLAEVVIGGRGALTATAKQEGNKQMRHILHISVIALTLMMFGFFDEGETVASPLGAGKGKKANQGKRIANSNQRTWSEWENGVDEALNGLFERYLRTLFVQDRKSIDCEFTLAFIVTKEKEILDIKVVQASPTELGSICLDAFYAFSNTRKFKSVLTFPTGSKKERVQKVYKFSKQYGRLVSLSNL